MPPSMTFLIVFRLPASSNFDLPELGEAIAVLKDHKFAKAVGVLKRALDISTYIPAEYRKPLVAELNQLLAYCLFQQGKFSEAIPFLEEQAGLQAAVPVTKSALAAEVFLVGFNSRTLCI